MFFITEVEEEKVYQEVINNDLSIPFLYLKLLAVGPAQVGKSTFLARLSGLMKWDIDSAPIQSHPQSSTGQGDFSRVCIKYSRDTIAIASDNEWKLIDKQLELEELVTEVTALLTQSNEGSNNCEIITPKLIQNTEIGENIKKQSVAFDDSMDLASSGNNLHSPNVNDGLRETLTEAMVVSEQVNVHSVCERFEKLRMQCLSKENSNVKQPAQVILNIADIGGQPAFLEMLPSLTTGPALYLIFINLTKGLQENLPVLYKDPVDEKAEVCHNYKYTSEEVIFTALSSIACFGHSDKEVEKYVQKDSTDCTRLSSLVLLMGTFIDTVYSDESGWKKTEAMDKQLRQHLQDTDFFKGGLVEYCDSDKDEVLFKVNNKSSGKKEVDKYRQLLEQLITNKFKKFNIPARWLMFSICLKLLATQEGKHTVSFSDCVLIGDHFGMNADVVRVALKFLHKYIGLVMFYPENESLQNLVICDPQVIFTSISELIFNVYTSKKRNMSAYKCQRFKKFGLFSPKDVKSDRKDLISIDNLVELLVHLNIAAQIPGEGTPEYFLPAVLTSADSKELEYKGKHLPEPLCIFFETGYLPLGLTCALIAELITMGKLDILLTVNQETMYKNKVTFSFKGKYNVQLISWPKYCEIRVTRASGLSVSTIEEFYKENCCPFIRDAILEAINHVIHKMRQTSIFHLSRGYDLAFKCPHLNNHEEESGCSGHEPLAVVSDALSDTPKEMRCVVCKSTTPLSAEMIVWYEKVNCVTSNTKFNGN